MFEQRIEAIPTSKNVGKKKDTNNQRKLSKYEKSILRPLKIISIGSTIAIALNLLLPLYQGSLGFSHILQWFICFIYVYCVLNSRGYTEEYSLSIGKFIVIRVMQFLFTFIRKSVVMNYSIFFILIFIDAIMISFLAYHKVNYEFEVEKYVK